MSQDTGIGTAGSGGVEGECLIGLGFDEFCAQVPWAIREVQYYPVWECQCSEGLSCCSKVMFRWVVHVKWYPHEWKDLQFHSRSFIVIGWSLSFASSDFIYAHETEKLLGSEIHSLCIQINARNKGN